jgi:hypothetical protein
MRRWIVGYKKRVETLRILAGGHSILSASSKLQAIYGEFNRISTSRRRNTPDAWLLTVLHTTRALDTCLSELLSGKGWMTATKSLGAYLKELESRNVLTPRQRTAYQRSVVVKRNKYMHEAGATPSNLEADRVLTDMHQCFVDVIARI